MLWKGYTIKALFNLRESERKGGKRKKKKCYFLLFGLKENREEKESYQRKRMYFLLVSLWTKLKKMFLFSHFFNFLFAFSFLFFFNQT